MVHMMLVRTEVMLRASEGLMVRLILPFLGTISGFIRVWGDFRQLQSPGVISGRYWYGMVEGVGEGGGNVRVE